MRVPYLDLRVCKDDRVGLLKTIDAVLAHGRIVLGPEVQELERRVADYCGRYYGVGVSSGTDALFLGLKSLGIGPGAEVITTSLSWIATANAIALTGATPVFADIGDDLNIDPASVRSLVSPKTKAIVPVHFTGKIANMPELTAIADEYNLYLVEDACQSFGAMLNGKRAGAFGSIACFSMNQMKIFSTCGDAGLIVTDREDIQQKLIALRHNGMVNRTECLEVSLNARIDTIHAAILLHRLPQVEGFIRRRREIAKLYDDGLADLVGIPKEGQNAFDCYYSYTIRADNRDELKLFLAENGIETQIQHPVLMSLQPAYAHLAHTPLPNAERLAQHILCLPNHEKLDDSDVIYVIDTVKKFYGQKRLK